MTITAAVYLVAFGAIISVLAFSENHALKGLPAALLFLTCWMAGVVLAVHAL